MLEIRCNSPLPTEPGMYVFRQANTTDPDGKPSLLPHWVFMYHGELRFLQMGADRGVPLDTDSPLRAPLWSERLVPAMEAT